MCRRVSLSLFVLLAFVWTAPASAQLLAAKDGPVVYGHHHLNATSPEEAKKSTFSGLGLRAVHDGRQKMPVVRTPR